MLDGLVLSTNHISHLSRVLSSFRSISFRISISISIHTQASCANSRVLESEIYTKRISRTSGLRTIPTSRAQRAQPGNSRLQQPLFVLNIEHVPFARSLARPSSKSKFVQSSSITKLPVNISKLNATKRCAEH